MTDWPQLEILGAPVDFLTESELVEWLFSRLKGSEQVVVYNRNLHGAYLQISDPDYNRALNAADLHFADGMPFVWIAKLLGLPVTKDHRTTFIDWSTPFFTRAAAENRRIFYLGGSSASLKLGLDSVRAKHPAIIISGADGYFDHSDRSSDSLSRLENISDFRPDILLVGMGMPLQELWCEAHLDLITAPVVMSIGAGLDYRSGHAKTPSRVLGPLGLEWLGRLCSDPRRLYKRYLIEPMYLFLPLLRDYRHHRKGMFTSGGGIPHDREGHAE